MKEKGAGEKKMTRERIESWQYQPRNIKYKRNYML